MKNRIILLLAVLWTFLPLASQITFTGNSHEVMEIVPAATTGLNRIYVLHDTENVAMHFTATTENEVTWYAFEERGGAYAEPVANVTHNGLETILPQVTGNRGYIIEEGTSRLYVWVTDYSAYRMSLTGLQVDNDGDCATTTLHVAGEGTDIAYYTINGGRQVLSRELELSYYNLEWNDTTHWQQTSVVETETSFKNTIVIPAPTCNTSFVLSGDRFLSFWDETLVAESNTYVTAAVDVRATATQESRDNDNEKKTDAAGGQLGGSAPAHVFFEAFVTDAVVHKEWQMALDPDFNDIQLRLNQDEVDETFTEAGTYYWRFIGSNADGSCEAYSETFTVNIGESELQCPNVFTPGTSAGVNDVWKVSYRSIIDFHCWIFNRWGVKVCEFTDPSQGWDGRNNGKLVGPGVYYYVIQATGSDGKKYKMSGDINIIRYKNARGGSSSGGTDNPTTHEDPDEP
ncbi:MAG: gliding motility-associated C-terminal domain-containing protein [Muribaculaceae bacterium]|nr:gliding motility-associated C-terminal domain-containing protein [Muribaculaceae bacterium]